jgi:hypothetical protein
MGYLIKVNVSSMVKQKFKDIKSSIMAIVSELPFCRRHGKSDRPGK